ncbi:hypothetical protein AB0O47_39810 [Streptomyces noursei]|uniref:hypothetical protein n=1 Tax=Streptomyces noursei TaxID=1971 RepID=UPI00344F4B05
MTARQWPHLSFTSCASGGYHFLHKGVRLLATKVAPDHWTVHAEGKFWGESTQRKKAAYEAIANLAADDREGTLFDAATALKYVREVKDYRAAVEVMSVRNAQGRRAGFTFQLPIVDGSLPSYGWVTTQGTLCGQLEHTRRDARQQCEAQGSPEREELERPEPGAPAAPVPTEFGTLPRYADVAAVDAALDALSAHGVSLLEVDDAFEMAAARSDVFGTLVLPADEDAPGRDVLVHWLDGESAENSTLRFEVYAEELTAAGFAIEEITPHHMRAHYPQSAEGAGKPSETWVLTDRHGDEVAAVMARKHGALMEIVKGIGHVMEVIHQEGGISRRRLSHAELDDRSKEGRDPAHYAAHECGDRGHSPCADGVQLPDPDAPKTPRHAPGGAAIDVTGELHMVRETVCKTDIWGSTTEVVHTTTDGVVEAEALTPVILDPSQVVAISRTAKVIVADSPLLACPDPLAVGGQAHRLVLSGGRALYVFWRTGDSAELAKASSDLLWAAGLLRHGAGPSMEVYLWRRVVRAAMEGVAERLWDAKRAVGEPLKAPHVSYFGAVTAPIADVAPEAYEDLFWAAELWAELDKIVPAEGEYEAVRLEVRVRVDRLILRAAEEMRTRLPMRDHDRGSLADWIVAVRYLAALHKGGVTRENEHVTGAREESR